ncbi:type II/IV secretion system ATPase subunit [Candidatus Woesearchaeota archaeon]|jgi:archaeal flagellar protein FlaI|nr:type II/IV secretion system ATPase subunit [Candidatus Woesearchaeota archaeon]MBT4114314.1 type II/IV secretion system ATPase subunit [Candidatus Woesearchaeota archaeon]MBT4248458.1 type II/IV secretion system ATPase subunit [Candidatus Woesearchaeota archaeon]
MISKKRRVIGKFLKKFGEVNYVRDTPTPETTPPVQQKQEETSISTVIQQIKSGTSEPVDIVENVSGTDRMPLPVQFLEDVEIKKDILSQIRQVNENYPLITTQIKDSSYPLAFAKVFYNNAVNQLQYNIVEPSLSPELWKTVNRTLTELHDRLEIDFNKVKDVKEINKYINKEIDDIWKLIGFKPKPYESIKIKYYIFREALGLGKIDALAKDPNIEDISCDGIGLPIYIYHRNPLYGEISTNIVFDTKDALDSFAMRLAQKCDRTISIASPLMDGSLPDGSRVQITYGTDIARRGSNFTIRKFFRIPLTPVDLLKFGTADPFMIAYLWLAIEREKSILVSGTTATGKTTLLNILSLFIEPNQKIVSIEDTAELQIPHVNWMPQVTRAGFGAAGYGAVSMFDLLTAALRQRPDYLIVGEVRGKEASVLFHAMSTGHPGLSTLHADSVSAVIDRLTTRPIELPASLLRNLDIIIFLEKTRKGDKLIRRIGKIIEVEGYDKKNNQLETNTVFEWMPAKDSFNIKDSHVIKKIADRAGWSVSELHQELMRRVKVLKWMQKNNIHNFIDVASIIHMYYINPQQLSTYMQSTKGN